LAFLAIMLLQLSAQAQTNQQIQDASNEITTVVIKEESESDFDILNDQFDINEIGMHQVVRITTEGKPVIDGPKPQVPEQVPVEVVEEKVTVTQVQEVKKAPEQQKEVAEVAKKETPDSNVGGTAVSNTKTYSSKKSNRRTAFKPYYDKRRFKKKKRKKRSKRSKRRGKCYSF